MGANSLSHTRWDCSYHIIFIPKYRVFNPYICQQERAFSLCIMSLKKHQITDKQPNNICLMTVN